MRQLNFLKLLLMVVLVGMPLPATRAQQSAKQASNAKSATTPTSAAAPLVAPASAAAAARTAAENIKAERLKEWLYYVAADERQGRDTPSKGLDETAQFIADHLKALKIKPGAEDGSYFQKIEMVSSKPDPAQSTAEVAGRAFKFGDDFLASSTNGSASGSLVYAGHGIAVKSMNINPYAGLDVRDKIVIAAGGVLPKGVTRAQLKGKAGEGDWDDVISYARKNGAKGVIVIPRQFQRFWQFSRFTLERDAYRIKRFIEQDEDQGGVPTIVPSAAMLDAIFAGEKQTGQDVLKSVTDGDAGEPFSLNADKRVSFKVATNTKTATTQNVVGILEGSDPVLKNEYVAIGAHYDHVGVGRPDKNGDTIYNGADDDGSGTVSVLALAEAFARGKRPRRSILFVWHCGEEKGLWGSQYFTEYPTVPLKQIVVQLNIDMIGRSRQAADTKPENKELTGPNEIYVIGSKEMSTELGQLSERINHSYLNISLNYLYDNPNDPNRFFYRSDHFNYAKRGIPIIFYFDGVHEDYHRPSDSPDKIDYQKMERVARTVFLTASELANAPRRPVVDKPLTPERIGS